MMKNGRKIRGIIIAAGTLFRRRCRRARRVSSVHQPAPCCPWYWHCCVVETLRCTGTTDSRPAGQRSMFLNCSWTIIPCIRFKCNRQRIGVDCLKMMLSRVRFEDLNGGDGERDLVQVAHLLGQLIKCRSDLHKEKVSKLLESKH